jgi:hypothetical protein
LADQELEADCARWASKPELPSCGRLRVRPVGLRADINRAAVQTVLAGGHCCGESQ